MRHVIFHERQQKKLSLVHCLNNLLQRSVVTQRYLTHLAIEIDKEEAQFAGEEYDETECSNHYDEQGNFSPKVLFRFVEKLNLMEIVDLESKKDSRAVAARLKTTDQDAFLCYTEGHWYTIRKFNDTWYSFDSRLPHIMKLPVVGPHISLFLSKDFTFTTEKFDRVYFVVKK